MNESESSYKILIVGDSGVGKSSLLLRFCDSKFFSSGGPTIGVDFKVKSIKINRSYIKLSIWDTYVF
jgi:small GTP-binding protein